MNSINRVYVSEEKITLPTYPEAPYEKLPMFTETRNHQGTRGKVYPSPVTNYVIRDQRIDKQYQAIFIENEYIQLIIIPEFGGRIFAALDKTNNYDFFYRQNVIKPALIGMFGSWISGGAEFNWPIHHRPSSLMPVDYHIQNNQDGSAIVWLSEHEPLHRMKGMVGICLQPGKAIFETRVRLYNRTSLPKSFLWWENIAVPVNKDYQIFFPTDVNYVYFHYKKSVAEYPVANNVFSGIDFRGGVDIRWHDNTKMATSFFSSNSNYDFFGGYDHGKDAGVIHVANHHISPGKKLFTWGHGKMAKAWEKTLTDFDGPYAELMAGVYTDNQPDFSWLEPYETKSFSQYWYPIKELGEPQNANCRAAICYKINDESLTVKLNVTEKLLNSKIYVYLGNKILLEEPCNLLPEKPYSLIRNIPQGIDENNLYFSVRDEHNVEIIGYKKSNAKGNSIPEPTKTVTSPYELKTADELYLAGLHIMQYRDPLIKPEIYWQKALRIQENHSSANNAMGTVFLEKGRFIKAETHFKKAIETLTTWNPNPRNGEVFYNLGLCLKYQDKLDEAYNAFYKSTWNYEWQSAGFYSLAEIDCYRGDLDAAIEHLKKSLNTNMENLKARNLLSSILRKCKRTQEALGYAQYNLAIDPLDYWALNEKYLLSGDNSNELLPIFTTMKSNSAQTCLDIAIDYGNAGLFAEACDLLNRLIDFEHSTKGQYPMLYYMLGYYSGKAGNITSAIEYYKQASQKSPDYCFPSRLEELLALQDVIAHEVHDARAYYYLGNLLYDKEQYEEALTMWEESAKLDNTNYIVYRNLAVIYFNNKNQAKKAILSLKKAIELKPHDTQLLYELNHVMKLNNSSPESRLSLLEANLKTVEKSDSLYLERIKIYNLLSEPQRVIDLFNKHEFTPGEGGEHEIIEQYMFAYYLQGRRAIEKKDYRRALEYFVDAQRLPENLGAGIWHLSLNVPYIYYEACCRAQLGEQKQAAEAFKNIASMVIDSFSESNLPVLPFYSAMSLKQLGRKAEADKIMQEFLSSCLNRKAKKDYGHFTATAYAIAYYEDPQILRERHYNFLIGMAYLYFEKNEEAKSAFQDVLMSDSNHLMSKLELEFLKDIL